MSWRDKYGDEGYRKGDMLGFYISLPDGERYEPQVSLNNKGKPFLVQGQDTVAHVPCECLFQIPCVCYANLKRHACNCVFFEGQFF
jgi:Set1/Ash2 histone methyltransferase complex subunit ASH2